MYLKLFNRVTDIIIELEEIQRQTEEMYINCEQPGIILMDEKSKNNEEEE